ncbi:MAG: nucleoside-diphosphate kinase [Candidatus Sumerlaeota bacterium]|nr:nucleoside-diphosphate kinase [Candidatus Sumerlaeota bacterium]
MAERTLILIKPDAVRRRLIGEIVSRIEAKGLKIIGMKMLRFDGALADAHYAEHVHKDFYPALRQFILSGPVVAAAVEGPDAVALMRLMMGKTRHTEAVPGTIRGDFAFSTTENLIHGSDSLERADIEMRLFFREDELFA